MRYRVIIRPEAENDLKEAFSWYEDKRQGLGYDLLLQVDAGLRFIERNPKISLPEYKEARKSIVIAVVAVMLVSALAYAVMIDFFPGLDKLINEADAIVILRVDRHVTDESPTLYSIHDCCIYQTLKGDIPTNKTIRLQLMDTRTSFVTPYAIHSTHLMFLTKKRTPDEPTDYRTIEIRGANVRLTPFRHEKMPAGKTTKDQIISLLKRTVEYNKKQHDKEQAFLKQMIKGAEGDAVNRAP